MNKYGALEQCYERSDHDKDVHVVKRCASKNQEL